MELGQLRVAVVVPHQDDELNIAGQVLPYFIETGAQVKVCFSTNGDARVYEGAIRYRETVAAAAVMGITEGDLVWLGYPDCKGSGHLYHDRFEDAAHPERMTTKCYGPAPTLSMALTGEEKPVCRESLRNDLELFLRWYAPDVIFVIDFDSHPDHRALSLLFEEALSRVIVADPAYRPCVLKKFAYAGCWYGPDDYYSFAPTKNIGDGSGGDRTGNPYLRWADRVCFSPYVSTITARLRDNAVYRAAKAYKSQVPWPNIARVCNGDVVYWPLRTDNLLYGAKMDASSGDPSGLLDLRRFDVKDIAAKPDEDNVIDVGWTPEPSDEKPTLRIRLNDAVAIARVELTASKLNAEVLSAALALDGASIVRVSVRPGETAFVLTGDVRHAQTLEIAFEQSGSRSGLVSLALYSCGDNSIPLPRAAGDAASLAGSQAEKRGHRLFRRVYFALAKRLKKSRRLVNRVG